MSLFPEQQNQQTEEILLVVGDSLRQINRRWWIALAAVVVLALPVFYLLKFSLASIFIAAQPVIQVEEVPATRAPLEIVETKIFDLGGGNYSGYARVKNINLEWGVPALNYAAEFSDGAGASLLRVPGTTYVLPASEKLIVLPRFTSASRPSRLTLALDEPRFRLKPAENAIPLEVQRRSTDTANGTTILYAVLVNKSPFTISKIDLPVVAYDSAGQVAAVNYTNIDDVLPQETRSFQYVWPGRLDSSYRIEISPEVNYFDSNIFKLGTGTSPFDDR